MQHHGEQLGVDLFKLWECGTIELPAFAARIADAADVLVNIEDVYIGGGPGAQRVMAAWMQLGAELRTAMATSVTHMYAACDAVIQIANNYAHTDTEAKKTFQDWRTYEITKHAHDPARIVFDTPSSRPQIQAPDSEQF